MTQNEAKAYVADDRNWHVIGVTEYARVAQLDYRSLTYIAIEVKRMNMTEFYLNKDTTLEWSPALYYGMDKAHHCLGYTIRPTQMAMEIWQESKK